jgi:hypothetical protein
MTAPLRAYWLERFRPTLFVPAAIGMTAAAGAATGIAPATFAFDVACTLLLLGQFRLWDDLADRERDRATYPARVLVSATNVAPFITTCLTLAIVNLGLAAWLRGTTGATALLALDAAAAAWYIWRPAARSATAGLVLLTKYPAFVLLLSVGTTASLSLVVLAAAATYGLACAFEIWHDASGPLRVTHQ